MGVFNIEAYWIGILLCIHTHTNTHTLLMLVHMSTRSLARSLTQGLSVRKPTAFSERTETKSASASLSRREDFFFCTQLSSHGIIKLKDIISEYVTVRRRVKPLQAQRFDNFSRKLLKACIIYFAQSTINMVCKK